MAQRWRRTLLGLAVPVVLASVWSCPVRPVSAIEYRTSRGDDLFYNYYVGPALVGGGVPAGLYPAPVPTPPLVGHTYITYQPLMPHEFLYKHHRHYYRHHPGQGWVTTKVSWW